MRGCLIFMLVHFLLPGRLLAQQMYPLTFDHNAEVVGAQFDENDNLLITSSANGIAKLWDPDTGRLIRSFGSVAPASSCFAAGLSPDGKLIAVIYGRGGKVWNTKFGDPVCQLSGFSDTIRTIHFSNNSKWLVTASLDGTARIWDVQAGKRHHSLNHLQESLGKSGMQTGVTDARFCNRDQSVITGSGDRIRFSQKMELDSAVGLDIQRQSDRYDSNLLVWDLKRGQVIDTLKGYPFAVSPDGSRIVTGSINIPGKDAHVWEAVNGKLVYVLNHHKGRVSGCAFSLNGKWIITVSAEEGTVAIWDAVTGKFTFEHNTGRPNHKTSASLSPDGKMISIFSGDSTRLLNTTSGKIMYTIPSGHPAVFSHDGKHLVVLNSNHATVVESATGKPVLVKRDPVVKGGKKILKVD